MLAEFHTPSCPDISLLQADKKISPAGEQLHAASRLSINLREARASIFSRQTLCRSRGQGALRLFSAAAAAAAATAAYRNWPNRSAPVFFSRIFALIKWWLTAGVEREMISNARRLIFHSANGAFINAAGEKFLVPQRSTLAAIVNLKERRRRAPRLALAAPRRRARCIHPTAAGATR